MATCTVSEGNLATGTAHPRKVRTAQAAHLPSGMAFRVTCIALLTALTLMLLGGTQALAQDRTLSLYNTHTHERLTVTYKRNGRFVQAGLNQLNRFLRDWRRDELTRIDPDLFDIIWTVYREVRASEPIHVVSAYRSPATNNMLRRRSSGVARNSQHTQGRAMDFFIPGTSAEEIRAAGLRLQAGGVGYYPRSNTPFVHLDTGSIRMWPRMTRSQLSRVFPNGRTVHIPADGDPMPGFELAQRDLQRSGGRISVATSSSTSRAQNDGDIVLPSEGGNGILAALFGGGRAQPPAAVPSVPAASGAPAATTQVASLSQPTAPVALEVASLTRDPSAVPSPVLPPYASADGTVSAASTVAGLNIPSPTPAPTIDDIQLAALGTPREATSPGAIALENAFATAQEAQQAPVALPPITREQQIAQAVPAPGQIAAIIEARFAEQRATQASLAGQVARVIQQPAQAQDQPALAQIAVAPQVQPENSLDTPGALSFRARTAEVAATPRFIPPLPVPATPSIQLASAPPAQPASDAARSREASSQEAGSGLVAAAFAAQSDTRTPAQSAIDLVTGSSDETASISQHGVTGRLYPIADDLTPGLAKHSIRSAQHANLVAPTGTVSLSPVVMQSTSFVPSGVFQLQTNGFGRPGS